MVRGDWEDAGRPLSSSCLWSTGRSAMDDEAHSGHAGSPGLGKALNQMSAPCPAPHPRASHFRWVLLALQCPAKSSASSLEEYRKRKKLPSSSLGLAWASARVPIAFVFPGRPSVLSCRKQPHTGSCRSLCRHQRMSASRTWVPQSTNLSVPHDEQLSTATLTAPRPENAAPEAMAPLAQTPGCPVLRGPVIPLPPPPRHSHILVRNVPR